WYGPPPVRILGDAPAGAHRTGRRTPQRACLYLSDGNRGQARKVHHRVGTGVGGNAATVAASGASGAVEGGLDNAVQRLMGNSDESQAAGGHTSASDRPPNLSPPGAGRRGAFHAA